MRRGLSIYGAFLGARLKMLLEYLQVVGIAGVWVVLQRVPRLEGWGFEELLLVYGLLIASRSLEHMFADNLWVLSLYLHEGSFDRFLVRPVDPLLHLLADRFHHHGLGNLLTGLVPFGFASYFPASHLLGRDLGLLAWAGPPLSVAFAVGAYGFWRVGLRRYSGAGS